MTTAGEFRSAAVVVPCADLHAALEFYRERLGFRLESIFPADDPVVAELSGHGMRLRLERGRRTVPGVLRVECASLEEQAELVAPDGTQVELVTGADLRVPALVPEFSVQRGGGFVTGRAGMRYRDLLPGRLGGRYVASHIRIEDGGAVADQVHFHRVRLQLIYCYRGWVEVVYEDQGPPFTLRPGDCVLQPPEIRHRVLRCSPGLEVIELSSPAEHETRMDYGMELPNGRRRGRVFGGQRFVRHQAAAVPPVVERGCEVRDLGLTAATSGLAAARVRTLPAARTVSRVAAEELQFGFLLEGEAELEAGAEFEAVAAGDAWVVPGGEPCSLTSLAGGCSWLEVTVPGP